MEFQQGKRDAWKDGNKDNLDNVSVTAKIETRYPVSVSVIFLLLYSQVEILLDHGAHHVSCTPHCFISTNAYASDTLPIFCMHWREC